MEKNSKVIFITGGSSGFGQSICDHALKSGHKVAATFRNQDEVDEFNKKSDHAIGVYLDVTNDEQINKGVQEVLSKFEKIDVLINNAGYGHFDVIEGAKEDVIQKQFDTNVFGLIKVTQAILPQMRERRSGHIINFSSIAGVSSMPGMGVYCGSKFAVEGITLALREEVASFDIKATLIEPGAFDTKFFENSTFDNLKKNSPEGYKNVVDSIHQTFEQITDDESKMGDPDKLAQTIVYMIENNLDATHVPLGQDSVKGFKDKIKVLQEAVDQWEEIGSQMSKSDDTPKKIAI